MRYSLKQEKNGFLSDIYQQKQKSKIENKLLINKKKISTDISIEMCNHHVFILKN